MEYDDSTLTLLAENGFSRQGGSDDWLGSLESLGEQLSVWISFPPEFPYETPTFKLQRPEESNRQAHIERSGKICINQMSGAVLDVTRPDMVLRDCFERATAVLNLTEEEERQQLLEEFLAYWSSVGNQLPILANLTTLCTGEKYQCSFELNGVEKEFVADNSDGAIDFLTHLSATPKSVTKCFGILLTDSVLPPPFGTNLSLAQLLAIIQNASEAGDFSQLVDWLTQQTGAVTLVISIPGLDGSTFSAAAIVPKLNGDLLDQAQRGFRPGHVPPAHQFTYKLRQRVFRIGVNSVDLKSLLARTAGREFSFNNIAVVGCGSVGSFVAESLCLSGVQELTLIDSDTLKSENVYRHSLGFDSLGLHKSFGLEQKLKTRFPQLSLKSYAGDFFDWLSLDDVNLDDYDLLVIAIGEETIERRINSTVFNDVSRLHVWLEALGVGGHLAYFDKDEGPCFECLYTHHFESGIPYNMAMLAAPNQSFRRTHLGCAGTYLPFGARFAQRVGVEVADFLSNTNGIESMIKSWRSASEEFTEQGYALSPRGASIEPDHSDCSIGQDFQRQDCPVCSAD